MHRGWIKIWRKLQDSELWTRDPFTRGQAWVDLLLLANHADGYIRVRGIRVDVRRGQVGYSHESLAKRWKWSRGKVSRFLEELEKMEQQIEQQKNNASTVITIHNYEQYQQNEQQNGQQTDSRRTADGQQTDTNKNDKKNKKNKNEEEKTNICPDQQAGSGLTFDVASGKFVGINEQNMGVWAEAYPAVNISGEIKRAEIWYVANPKKRKRNIYRFLTNWFSRNQERGGNLKSNSPYSNSTDQYIAETQARLANNPAFQEIFNDK